MRDLTEEEYQRLKADIKEYGGLQEVIHKDDEGNTLCGHFREKACQELGLPIPDYKIIVHEGLSEKEKIELINRNENLRRQMTSKDWHASIDKLLKLIPDESDRQIGKLSHADNKTVAKIRKNLEEREEIPHITKRKDSRGRTQPARRQPPRTLRPRLNPHTGDPLNTAGVNAEIEKQNARALKPKYFEGLIDTFIQLRTLISYLSSGKECFNSFNELVNQGENAYTKSEWQAVCDFAPLLANWFKEFAEAIEAQAEPEIITEPESGNSQGTVH